MRVIIDNDFSGDPDDLIQTAHHLMCPSVEIPLIIGSHLAPGDFIDPSTQQAENARRIAEELLAAMGLAGRYRVLAGAELALGDRDTPRETPAARAIIAEAMRTDRTDRLFYAAGAGLTDLASALLIAPEIAAKMTLVWIGGPEYPGDAPAPPGSRGREYNLNIDCAAVQRVFDSDIAVWQVPRNVYRQALMSYAELIVSVGRHGALGAYLQGAIERIMERAVKSGYHLGEVYAMGDSPLVTLTALQSAFEADPASSVYALRPRPSIRDDGSYGPALARPPIRVYTQIDTRLTFADFFAKLELWRHAGAVDNEP
jgi:purine nucleosidase